MVTSSINITSDFPRAPAVIRNQDQMVSSSDYGSDGTEKLLIARGIEIGIINDIILFRTICKTLHAYKEVQLRRSGDRYSDHTNGVMLMLLLEFGENDPDLLMAAMGHDVLEDVKIKKEHLYGIINKMSGGVHVGNIIKYVTNPVKTGSYEKDLLAKKQHYSLILEDQKASKIKVADRCYNLRTLEVIVLDESLVTDEMMETAQKQIQETRTYIFPIAEKLGGLYHTTLLNDIDALSKKVQQFNAHQKTKQVSNILG